jgi:hypothetical protein
LTAKTAAAKPRADFGLSLKDARVKAADILRGASPEQSQEQARAMAQARDLALSFVKARQDAREARKTQAYADVLRLRDQFKLIRKIYANNPQEMARQLGKIFKELKAALKAYGEATKGDPGAKPPEPSADVAAAKAESAPKEPSPEAPREDARATLQAGASAYMKQGVDEDRLVRQRRDEQAQMTLAFVDEVRGLVKEIVKTYVEAKIKAAFLGKGRDERSEPFKETDKALKELEEAMGDLEADAKADLLPPTMRVSA